jgi:sulfate/thiosulfate transport system substrate-binding protein
MLLRAGAMMRSILMVLLCVVCPSLARADAQLLNVSYDVTREFYKDVNAAFTRAYKENTGEVVTVNQSHGGSSKQARSVLDGLAADVVTMNQASDIDMLYELGKLVPADWAKRLPNRSVPTTSTSVFLVRKGNPKQIRDWSDLVRDGVQVVVPNPKTSGNGRYSYLAAYGYALKKGRSKAEARAFVQALFKNVPVLDTGGRGATTTFVERKIGDVLLTFENEVFLIKQELGGDQFEVVYPSISVLAENPVSIVDRVVDKKGTRKLAQAYLDFLYSDAGQELAVKHRLRPLSAALIARHPEVFPKLTLFSVDEVFGSFSRAQKEHFDEGATFDQIMTALHKAP